MTTPSRKIRPYRNITDDYIEEHLEELVALAVQTNIPLQAIIQVRTILELERTNNLYVDNAELHDEEMMRIINALEHIAYEPK